LEDTLVDMTETHVLNDISFPLLFEGVEKKTGSKIQNTA